MVCVSGIWLSKSEERAQDACCTTSESFYGFWGELLHLSSVCPSPPQKTLKTLENRGVSTIISFLTLFIDSEMVSTARELGTMWSYAFCKHRLTSANTLKCQYSQSLKLPFLRIGPRILEIRSAVNTGCSAKFTQQVVCQVFETISEYWEFRKSSLNCTIRQPSV